jgi:hypothetical protein
MCLGSSGKEKSTLLGYIYLKLVAESDSVGDEIYDRVFNSAVLVA